MMFNLEGAQSMETAHFRLIGAYDPAPLRATQLSPRDPAGPAPAVHDNRWYIEFRRQGWQPPFILTGKITFVVDARR
jgi:hypothetical protein